MTITAKFASRCVSCGQAVTPGQQIEWTKGTIGQRQQTRMDRTGWTGCRCGSIEGQPRRSDCASCQHDY